MTPAELHLARLLRVGRWTLLRLSPLLAVLAVLFVAALKETRDRAECRATGGSAYVAGRGVNCIRGSVIW
jgi:hypothetical protein